VIDTDKSIQQSVVHDNPDILWQLIDEKIDDIKLRDTEFPKENPLTFYFACANLR
jgi:hypothetical protein